MHKLAYAEFVQDGGRQLKFRKCYYDIPPQLYAMERQKYKIRYSMGKPGEKKFLVPLSFKKRLRVSRDTFQFLLHTIADDIKKETTRFKKPTSPELQLALTLYTLAMAAHMQLLETCLA